MAQIAKRFGADIRVPNGMIKPHGWIILDKPVGLGSTQAVAAVKRALREYGVRISGKGPGKTKVGHGGTLDPLASGVLPIAIGEATKLTGRMLDAVKTYDFTIGFGVQTDTLDAEGQVVATCDHRPTGDDIMAVLPHFTGVVEQMPPAFSALKVDGRRAYDLARAGEDVELAARTVEIMSLQLQDRPSHDERVDCATLTATVSKGTYIRSLARDIALALGTVGRVTMLRRTKAGPFTLEQAISLDNLAEPAKGAPFTDVILPIEAGLVDIPALCLTPDQARKIRQGQQVVGIAAQDGQYLARDGQHAPLALVEARGHMLRVLRGLNME